MYHLRLRLQCTVTCIYCQTPYVYVIDALESTTAWGRMLPAEYYARLGVHIPDDATHYELRLVDALHMPQGLPLHAKRSGATAHLYIVYPGHVASFAHVRDICSVWCLGTTFTLREKKDFVPILSCMYWRDTRFIEHMQTCGYTAEITVLD